MMWTLLLTICLVVVFGTAKADYEDIRCVCVCPPLSTITGNTSMMDKKVYRLPNLSPENCNCEYVLDESNVTSLSPSGLTEFCLRCQCEYEKRQTTTMKVVVIFIVCVVAILFVYMLFLLILDPLMNKTRPQYRTQIDEDVSVENVVANRDTESLDARASRPRNVVQRMRSEQEKWKDTVEVQRKHIFDRHTMLN